MEKPASPTFPLVVITNERLRRKAELVSPHEVSSLFFDEPFASEETWWVVDAEGRRVRVHENPDRLVVDEEASDAMPCGFCFERSFTTPRFPPRCDACAAESLCWCCRERPAAPGPFTPAAPLPRCDECRDALPDWVALPPQPKATPLARLLARLLDAFVLLMPAIGLAALFLIARACLP